MGIGSEIFTPALRDNDLRINQVIILKQHDEESKNGQTPKDLPFWSVILSVIQASFGVQSSNNRERDFKQGKLLTFITAALIFTAIFIGTLLLIVRWVLSTT